MESLMKSDLYALLQVSHDATEKELRKAYRKKALTCHPDKNQDNPKAAELFQQLSRALEILCDAAARSAYDRVLKAQRETEARHRNLDSKRRKLKDDLEAREKAARYGDDIKTEDASEKLLKEIERLRKEGSHQLEEEREKIRQQIIKEEQDKKAKPDPHSNNPRLKVRWKKKGDASMYSHAKLMEMFQKYGVVTCLVMGKKGNSALVEFSSTYAAKLAQENEVGSLEDPVSIEWVHGRPPEDNPLKPTEPPVQTATVPEGSGCLTNRDYESLVMMRLRQAEERKKLMEEMLKEDV